MKMASESPNTAGLGQVVVPGARRDELEAFRLSPDAQLIGSLGLPLPNALGLSLLPVLFCGKDVCQLLLEGQHRLLAPYSIYQGVGMRASKLKMLYGNLKCFCLRQLITLVENGILEHFFVHKH